MSIDKTQLRGLIRDVLSPLKLWSEDAEELLMLTCAVESNLGTYLRQISGGPALGIFQMEPRTSRDIVKNYLRYKQDLAHSITSFLGTNEPLQLFHYNIATQIIFCRLHYLRVPKRLPPKEDVRGMANYHKKYYNTSKGKSTVKDTIKKYKRYILDG